MGRWTPKPKIAVALVTAILVYLATSVLGVAELPEMRETLINAAPPVIAGYLWPERADPGNPGNDGGPQ
jgi:hypothetical protein